MRKLQHYFSVALFLSISTLANAQGGKDSEIGEFMRSSGRIYVVVAVVLTILFGLILYLVKLDRKIRKMEKEG